MIQLYSSFEHSTFLEVAISQLEKAGVPSGQIFAVPLVNRKLAPKLFDSIHHSDGVSLVSTGAALGTASSVVGASVGFQLEWGPIYWGLIGAIGGFLIGFILDWGYFSWKNRRKPLLRGKLTEVILVVECTDQQAQQMEEILWKYLARGVARIKC